MITDEEAVDKTLKELRAMLQLDKYGKSCEKTFSDYVLFSGFPFAISTLRFAFYSDCTICTSVQLDLFNQA